MTIVIVLGLALGLTWLITGPLHRLALNAHARLKSHTYHVDTNVMASELANRMIKAAGLESCVKVESEGDTTSQASYDSDTSLVHIPTALATSTRLLDGFVAAHEVGHAIIDHSSRLVKGVCDLSAHMSHKWITGCAGLVFGASALTGWTAGMGLAVLVLGIQVVSGLVLQATEAQASRYALMVLNQLFSLSPTLYAALKTGARAAQTTQATCLGTSSALVLVFSQLTTYHASPLLAIPMLGAVLYAYLLVATQASCLRRSVNS